MGGEMRRQEILRLLRQRGGLAVRELCDYFQVSRMTIHRDLRQLERNRLVARIHGGLVSAGQFVGESRCACQRALLPHQQSRLLLPSGEVHFCCCSCAFQHLAERSPKLLWVSDFMTGQTLLATDAYYLMNSMAIPCCQPSILSFAEEGDVLNFRSGFGGAIGQLEEALGFLRLEQTLKQD